MNDPTLHDKIEAFLTGQMAAGDAEAFRREMAADQRLASEVELQRLEHDAMNLLLEKDLQKKMAYWDDAPPPNPFGDDSGKMNYLKIGLPILLVGLFALWGGYQYFASTTDSQPARPSSEWPAQPDETAPVEAPGKTEPADNPPVADAPDEEQPEKEKTEKNQHQAPDGKSAQKGYLALAANTYQPPAQLASGLKSGDPATEKTLLQLAAEAFDGGDFAKAAQLLGPPSESDQSQVRYLRGHVYFNQKKYPAAETEFEAVVSTRISQYKQDARWYLLLTYLAQLPAKKAAFEALAGQLADEQNQYSRMEEVRALLKKLAAVQQ
ncbi:MAG: hypothetical protein H6577_02245 [Lewinellaceae bacterium]|nr:hypothetical protein [Saprospiraceae bacterium]MCB9336929.1 hypothetical protein [Lewinellaceae bacterium]